MRTVGALILAFSLVVFLLGCTEDSGDNADRRSVDPPTVEDLVPGVAGLAVGQSANTEGLRITIEDIQDPFTSSNASSSAPKGQHVVAYRVIIENLAGDEAQVDLLDFKLIDDAGLQYDPEPDLVFDEDSLDATTLAGNAKTAGWFGFAVNDGSKPVRLTYDPDPVGEGDIEFAAAGAASPTGTPVSRCVPGTPGDATALEGALNDRTTTELVGLVKVKSGDHEDRGFYAARLGFSGEVAVWFGGWPDIGDKSVMSVNGTAKSASVWPYGPETVQEVTLGDDGAKEAAACVPAKR